MKTSFMGLVKLLAKSLYPEPDVSIRELTQNAHDSIQLRRVDNRNLAGKIEVFTDPENRTITFIDNGWRWVNRGNEDYELSKSDDASNPGTKVVVAIAPDFVHHINEESVRETIKRYTDFLPYSLIKPVVRPRQKMNGSKRIITPQHCKAEWTSPFEDGAESRGLGEKQRTASDAGIDRDFKRRQSRHETLTFTFTTPREDNMDEKRDLHSSVEQDLKGMPVMLSASVPIELSETPRAQDVYTAIVLFVHQVVASGGRIVFGGHPSITPLVQQAISRLGKKGVVDLFQAKRFENQAPKEIRNADVFGDIRWVGDGAGSLDDELGEMRSAMAESSKAAVFVGGKTVDSLTERAGVRDEYDRFLEKHPDGPVYLVGFMDGEAKNIIDELESKNEREKNTLSNEELEVVHHSRSIDLVVSLKLDILIEFKTIGLTDIGMAGRELKESSLEGLRESPFVQKNQTESETRLETYKDVLESKYGDALDLKCFSVIALGFDRLIWKEFKPGDLRANDE